MESSRDSDRPTTGSRASRGARHRIVDLAAHPHAFITPRAFAEYLDVERRVVLKWIHAGLLPAFKFDHQWRIKRTDAIAFAEGERTRP